MKLPRTLFNGIKEKIVGSNKIIILYGARQVGKTTLVKDLIAELPYRFLSVNADERKYLDVLSSRDFHLHTRLISGYDGILIDEAQRIPEIGLNLKIIHDRKPEFKIITTGSSSFDLAHQVQEPLTGRTWTFQLFPMSCMELGLVYNEFELRDRLEELLVYGSYPEVFSYSSHKDKEDYLRQLTTSYLYKDVLELSSIRHSDKIYDLLRLLAFQIGAEVSLSEIGRTLSMGKETVASYIDLLQKSFVLFRLSGYSRNLRKEVTRMDKIYFYDTGVRNSIIDNFKTRSNRNDFGQLWENFLIIERLKWLNYTAKSRNVYYWRTYTGAELDYVEEHAGKLEGYEFKLSKKKSKIPAGWKMGYPDAAYTLVNNDNFLEFINPSGSTSQSSR